jgi:hypothetical protein
MSETDRELDAAWRAASREEPPAALDATIRAAARRAVAAGPARARPPRWWPLAAAAAVAVISVGIVQLTPPEQVTPTIIADDSRLAGAMKKDLDKLATAAPAPQAIVAPARSSAEPVAEVSAEHAAKVLRKQLAQAPATEPSGAGVARDEKRAAEPAGAASANISRQFVATPEGDRALKSKTEMAAAPAEATAPAARSEPFPAAPPEIRRAENAPGPGLPPAAVAAAKPMAGPSRVALAARADEAQSGAPAALGKVANSEHAKEAAPRPADEWIKLIRRLKSEGRNEEAAKELAAFRAAYKDRSDALLPADLREAKP